MHGERLVKGDRLSLALLVVGPPASGKSCLVSQLVMHTLRWPARDTLVPIAIKVVELERLLLAPRHRATFASAWNWADAYLRATLGRAAPRYRFLRQAMPTPTPTLTLTLNRTLTLTLTLTPNPHPNPNPNPNPNPKPGDDGAARAATAGRDGRGRPR